MLQTLGERDKCAQLFESLCGQWVTNPQEVIRLLWYETVDGNFIPTNDIVITEDDQSSVKTFSRDILVVPVTLYMITLVLM